MRVAVPAARKIGPAVRRYLVPAAGLVAGAGLAQIAASALISPDAADTAAGVGGIAGALVAALAARRRGGDAGSRGGLPRVVAVLDDDRSAQAGGTRVDSPRPPRVQ